MSYLELQVTSHYSFLRGASSCEELFALAANLGIEALAVVDLLERPGGRRGRALTARQTFDWCFRNRETGGITVAQAPNLTLWVVIAAGILRWIWPSGTPGVILTAFFKGGLVIWAADEIFRGVNPWRRLLGAAVLLYEIVTILA